MTALYEGSVFATFLYRSISFWPILPIFLVSYRSVLIAALTSPDSLGAKAFSTLDNLSGHQPDSFRIPLEQPPAVAGCDGRNPRLIVQTHARGPARHRPGCQHGRQSGFGSQTAHGVVRSVRRPGQVSGPPASPQRSCRRFGQICDLLVQPSCRCATLDLRHNHLDADDAARLADVITMNATITSLDLRFNDLGTDGALHISTAMQFNRSLQHCQLQGNRVDPSLLSRLEDYCRRNRLHQIHHEERPRQDRFDRDKLLYRLRFESAQVCNQHAVTKRRLLLSEQRLAQLEAESVTRQRQHDAQLQALADTRDRERFQHDAAVAHLTRLQESMREQFDSELQQHLERNRHWQAAYDEIVVRHGRQIADLHRQIAGAIDGQHEACRAARDADAALVEAREELTLLRGQLARGQHDAERLRQENATLTASLSAEADARLRLQAEHDLLAARADQYGRRAVQAELRFQSELRRFERARQVVRQTFDKIIKS